MMVCTALLAACKTTAAPEATARGEATVQQWCSLCHDARGTSRAPEDAPTFEQIAHRPGRDARYLRRFLDQDHFPMSTYRLFDAEKDDVVAFIISLRQPL